MLTKRLRQSPQPSANGRLSALPTVDLYFREPLVDLIAAWPGQRLWRPIRRIGTSAFAANGCAVIIRYATPSDLAALKALRPRRTYYVIDDVIPIAGEFDHLPARYRRRLQTFAKTVLPEIVAMADEILAPSRHILDLFPGRPGALISPCHGPLAADLSHFDEPGTIRIAFLGTRSHAGNLARLAEPLARLCVRHPAVEVTTFLGQATPSGIRRLPRVRTRAPLPWRAYRRVLATERYHIALAPIGETLFDRARSVSKIFHHAAIGAAGFYSEQEPYRGVVSDGVDGVIVADGAAAWFDALSAALDDVAGLAAIARGGIALARRIGAPDRLRQFWLRRLDIAPSDRR